MSVLNENQLLGAPAGSSQYQIQRSIRLNAPDSAYLSRTPASAGNRKTWTWSGWVKRSAFNASHTLFGAYDGASGAYSRVGFVSGDVIWFQVGGSASVYRNITAAVYRDPGAWMHIVAALDTTQATASDRVRLWVNGQLQTFATTSYPPLDYASGHINENRAQALGAETDGTTTSAYFPGYLADIHFIDGQALTPSSFGETDATTGEWIPKAYTGTYGTNGFKLDFADNSAATAAALGKDTSGNGNNWTPNNLSVTAGAGNDSLVDTPTSYGTDTGVGGEVRGNYCTWNPLSGSLALSNGNLEVPGGSAFANRRGTVGVSSGKWYVEFTLAPGQAATSAMVGWYDTDSTAATYTTGKGAWYYSASGGIYVDGANTGNTTAANPGDIIGMSLDADARQVKVYLNNTLLSTKTVGVAGGYTPVVFAQDAAYGAVLNAGQRPFAYTAPAGFKALCDTNLAAPTIVKPSTVMDVLTWSGTTGSRSLSGLGFSPDLVWGKVRNTAGYDHQLYDSVRGAGNNKELCSNLTAAEGAAANLPAETYGYLSSFDSNGFSTTAGTTSNDLWNAGGGSHVAWCWDAGSSTVTNTAGTIQSSVRANPSAGFSVVTWNYNGTNATVGHGLGVAPGMIIAKRRDDVSNWFIYHSGIGPNAYMYLNSTAAQITNITGVFDGNSSTVFEVNNGLFPGATATYVAYCFAPVAGYSAFGSYTGNGSADGPFVYTGFRPAWILIKQTTTASTTNWVILDCKRAGYNVDNDALMANAADAESTTDLVDITSNGFKMRSTAASVNVSSGTYIYAAFAEFPFQYARAR